MELLNTLFVTTQGVYLALDHETLLVRNEGAVLVSVPLRRLASVCVFGDVRYSSDLAARLVESRITFTALSARGRVLYRMQGISRDNVALRLKQYALAQDPEQRAVFARAFVAGKVKNAGLNLRRMSRERQLTPGELEAVENAILTMKVSIEALPKAPSVSEIMGLEGTAARAYFDVYSLGFSSTTRDRFFFSGRNRRPPRDPVNALLSLTYSILANDCAAALWSAGLDPAVGIMHSPRVGRDSLAMDLMEEFRPFFADRLILSLLNLKQMGARDFDFFEGGSVLLSDTGRKKFLGEYEKRKFEEIQHSLLKERVAIGLLPHVQARLLARAIRSGGEYVPFVAG